MRKFFVEKELPEETARIALDIDYDTFKQYIDYCAFLLLRVIFKDFFKMYDKFGILLQGVNCLSVKFDFRGAYIQPTDNYVTNMRSNLKNHMHRPAIGNICIQAFVKHTLAKRNNVVSYMAWNFMRACKFLSTGIMYQL